MESRVMHRAVAVAATLAALAAPAAARNDGGATFQPAEAGGSSGGVAASVEAKGGRAIPVELAALVVEDSPTPPAAPCPVDPDTGRAACG